MARTRFSFLTAGPLFEMDLDDAFDSVPETSSPLSTNFGRGHRAYVFVPAHHDAGMSEHRLIDTLTDRDGRTVELYEHRAEPPLWFLRWLLANGAIYTHLREAEGAGWAPIIVNNLGVVEHEGGPPVLLPEPPLGRSASARAGFQETARFWSSKGSDWTITLRRPGYLPAGKVMRDPDRSRAVLRGGGCCGVECVVETGTNSEVGRNLMSRVMSSLAET